MPPALIAESLGLPETTVRRFARESGIGTRLERNRLTFTEHDVEKLTEWIEARNQAADEAQWEPRPNEAPEPPRRRDLWGN